MQRIARARSQTSSSTRRGASMTRPVSSNVAQAATTSAAGSPTPAPPKSITALMRRSRASTFGRSRSVSIHAGAPAHSGACSARSQAACAPAASITSPAAAIASRVTVSSSRSGRRPPNGASRTDLDRPQFGHEPGELLGRAALIDRAIVGRAMDPPIDRPGEGIVLAWAAVPDRLGNRQRDPRRSRGSHSNSFFRSRAQRPTRQPHAQLVTQPVDHVDRPGRAHPLDRQAGVAPGTAWRPADEPAARRS